MKIERVHLRFEERLIADKECGGYYLKITLEDGEIVDKKATKRAKQRIQEKLERLRRGEHLE